MMETIISIALLVFTVEAFLLFILERRINRLISKKEKNGRNVS
jgi:hypothetical protein